MNRYSLELYLLTIQVFFVVDLLWLLELAKDFFLSNYNHLLSTTLVASGHYIIDHRLRC